MDNEERYQSNLNETESRAKLAGSGWIDNSFSYTFNSHGFRSEEFDGVGPSIMFLGASIVLGTGCPYEYTWPYLVSKELKLTNYNLGISGGSNDSSFRIAKHYLPHLKPDIIIYVNSYNWRLDLVTDHRIFTFWNIDYNTPKMYKPFYKEWLRCPENADLNYLKNTYALYELADQYSIPIVEIDGYELHLMSKHTYGRDIMHPGLDGHEIIANFVLSKIP